MNDLLAKEWPRLVISGLILIPFGLVLWAHPDNGILIGALVAMTTTVKDYWLGSSKGSSDKSEQIQQLQEDAK